MSEPQRSFVATNAKSIAEAHFHPEAWFRAIYANDEPVGFLMLHDESLHPTPRQRGLYYLWRLMVAEAHQGKGHGLQAIELLIDHVRTRPDAAELLTTCIPGKGSPEPFYIKAGFQPTGKLHDGEVELRRGL